MRLTFVVLGQRSQQLLDWLPWYQHAESFDIKWRDGTLKLCVSSFYHFSWVDFTHYDDNSGPVWAAVLGPVLRCVGERITTGSVPSYSFWPVRFGLLWVKTVLASWTATGDPLTLPASGDFTLSPNTSNCIHQSRSRCFSPLVRENKCHFVRTCDSVWSCVMDLLYH